MYATLGVFHWVQFKVKLNESEKIEKKRGKEKWHRMKCCTLFCCAVPIMSIQLFLKWMSSGFSFTLLAHKSISILMHSVNIFCSFHRTQFNCTQCESDTWKTTSLDLVTTLSQCTRTRTHTTNLWWKYTRTHTFNIKSTIFQSQHVPFFI